jgi:hypothetical protein
MPHVGYMRRSVRNVAFPGQYARKLDTVIDARIIVDNAPFPKLPEEMATSKMAELEVSLAVWLQALPLDCSNRRESDED